VECGFNYFLLSIFYSLLSTLGRLAPRPLEPFQMIKYKFSDLLIESLRGFHHHHMAGIGKNLQFRTLDSMVKKLGILYGRKLVILSTEDKRGKINLLKLFYHVKLITCQEVAMEDIGPTSHHIGNASFDKHQRSFSRVRELGYLSNRFFKIGLYAI